MSHRAVRYNVAPRYTPGSPAQVDIDTAQHVADQELRAYHDEYPGQNAEHCKEKCSGIVEELVEKADCWFVTDMITGKQFIRMFPSTEPAAARAKRAFRLRAKYRLDVVAS